MHKTYLLTLILIATTLGASNALAKETFSISISILRNEQHIRPVNNIFTLTDGYIPPFVVHVQNNSNDYQKLYEDVAGERLSSVTFEVTDEKDNKNTITKAISVRRSSMHSYQHLAPGGIRDFQVVINREEWNNAFKLYDQGARKLKFRAIFLNANKKIYSDYYYLILE